MRVGRLRSPLDRAVRDQDLTTNEVLAHRPTVSLAPHTALLAVVRDPPTHRRVVVTTPELVGTAEAAVTAAGRHEAMIGDQTVARWVRVGRKSTSVPNVRVQRLADRTTARTECASTAKNPLGDRIAKIGPARSAAHRTVTGRPVR